MQAVLSRRSSVRVRCSGEEDFKKINDRMQNFRKNLVADKKRLEDLRTNNFRQLQTALKQIMDDEVQFVRTLCDRSTEKPVEVVEPEGYEEDDEE